MIDENGDHILTGTWNGCTIVNETSTALALAMTAILNDILDFSGNKATISGNTLTIFEDDGVTVWKQYDITNGDRIPL